MEWRGLRASRLKRILNNIQARIVDCHGLLLFALRQEDAGKTGRTPSDGLQVQSCNSTLLSLPMLCFIWLARVDE